jgi:Anti-sigma factor NepR
MAKENEGDPGSKPVDAPTARRRQDAIGRRLRQMYEEVVSEPVPDDFLGFLQQADTRGDPSDKGGTQGPSANGKSTSDK